MLVDSDRVIFTHGETCLSFDLKGLSQFPLDLQYETAGPKVQNGLPYTGGAPKRMKINSLFKAATNGTNGMDFQAS
jgi:hypothetical protein